jgi:type II pantothenate kinase
MPPNKRNGALTPLVLDASHILGAGSALRMDTGVVRDSMLRRTVQHFPGGSMNFERFETDSVDECVRFVQDLVERSAEVNGVSVEEMKKGVKIVLTGGGAHKFHELFGEALGGVDMRKEDEMECLIEGLKFITLIPDEAYYFSDELIDAVAHPHSAAGSKYLSAFAADEGVLPRPSPDPPKYAVTFMSNPTPQLPCLLVNIGSGVSIIKVDEDGTFERVSGTSLGGGTLWGLLSLMTPATSFDGEPSTNFSYASVVSN